MLAFRSSIPILRVLSAGATLGLLASAAAGQGGLKVVVLEGDGAINNIREHSARAPVIRVEENGDPVNGAVVNFVLPSVGAGGTFEGGHTTFSTETGSNGQAVARGLRPNDVAGEFQIRVSASYLGRTATAIITQTNAAPAVSHAGLGKKIGIAALVAGALAGVLVAVAGRGGSSSATPAAVITPGTVITPGSPSFGPPR